jgi:hypothetical protein
MLKKNAGLVALETRAMSLNKKDYSEQSEGYNP